MKEDEKNTDNKYLRTSAILLIIGALLGPLTVFIAALIKPQPAWINTATFIANYNWVQIISIFFGFPLILGFALFISSAYQMAEKKDKVLATMAIMLGSIGGVLAVINYAMNGAYIPNNLSAGNTFIEAFSMVNPNSISWVFEMFAYAFLGAATWLVAQVFSSERNFILRRLLAANGAVSIFTGVMAAVNLSWVQSLMGLVSYVLWNLLVAGIGIFILRDFKLMH